MSTLKFQAPANSGGFTVGNETYKVDADGVAEVHIDHVEMALSHGFRPIDALPVSAQAPAADPNVQRPDGYQPVVQPGNDAQASNLDPSRVLTNDETAQALAEAAAAKGSLLTDDEKTQVLKAAAEAKVAAAQPAAEAAPTKSSKKG